jgi:NDP-sugar pyrophosphorylase family protein
MQIVVLAGGLGTRMLPLTRDVPKFLLDVAGRPFAWWLLERLASQGFDEAIVCVGYLGDEIRGAVGDGARFGLRVRYADEGPVLLGTAGALRSAIDLLDEAFVVTYGDSYLPFDYRAPLDALRGAPSALGAMAVFENRDAIEPSNTAVSEGRVRRYDKTRAPGEPPLDHIDYGAMALRREVVAALPAGEPLGLDRVQADLARRGALLAVTARDRFFEIGSPGGRADLEAHLARRGA